DAPRAARAHVRRRRQRHRSRRGARPRGARLPRRRSRRRAAPLGRRVRRQRRPQPGAAQVAVRGDGGGRVVPRPAGARAAPRRFADALTGCAGARRGAGRAGGEPPVRHGYPPSVFAVLPRLLERTGRARTGSITAVYSVLVAGGDMEEPIADEVRGILDGHIVLDRELGARGRWPAIDVLRSLSRVMPQVTSSDHRAKAAAGRELLATYERQRDLILLGAYRAGSDRRVDEAIARIDAIEAFLRQPPGTSIPFAQTLAELSRTITN